MYVGGNAPAPELTREEDADLRKMILAMVDEPLVLVVKLADRLHNMRTVFALRPDRQRAVAIETMQVWCSLAERLGMYSLKVGPRPTPSVPFGLLPAGWTRRVGSNPSWCDVGQAHLSRQCLRQHSACR